MTRTPYSYRNDPSVPEFMDDKPIIVFDGYCVLCSRFARFVIRHDRHQRFRFLAAQSVLGEALYGHFGLKSGDYDTNLLIMDGRVRVKSDGTLAMFTGLGGLWSGLGVFRIIPPIIRDALYNIIARNRLRWFGRQDACFLPPEGEQDRFL